MAFTLRLLQQNIGGSQQVTEEITNIAIEQEIDVALLHEPFNPEGKIEDLYPSVKIVTGTNNEAVALAAIAIFNEELEIWKVSELCNDRCVCIQIRGDFGDLFLVSLYFPLADDIYSCLTTLQVLLEVLREERILIGVDANAQSIWWSNSERTDDRGDKLEDLIISSSLCVLNRKDPLGLTWNGRSYTDVSLVTYNIVDRIMEWQSESECTSYDGRTVAIEINLTDYTRKNETCPPSSEAEEEQSDDVELTAFPKAQKLFEETQVASACTVKRKNYPWWTDDLDNFRREVCKAKLKMQSNVDVNLMHHFKICYLKRKKAYNRAIRMAKRAYDKQFAMRDQDASSCEIKNKDESSDVEAKVPVTSSEGSTLHWDEYITGFDNELVHEGNIDRANLL
jgi:hypothetical protein